MLLCTQTQNRGPAYRGIRPVQSPEYILGKPPSYLSGPLPPSYPCVANGHRIRMPKKLPIATNSTCQEYWSRAIASLVCDRT
jgi:hypothetical protein